jgi:L-amino acid N-acyltransferase YncA
MHPQLDIDIRPATNADFDAIWSIFRVHVEAGETYTFEGETTRDACHEYWLGAQASAYVAVMGSGRVAGMYKLMPNQSGRGAHVANASFMVAPTLQGAGVGASLGRHSLDEARRLGFLAMQFNFVVSTNTAAVRLWKKLGFSIVGTLPRAYRHRRLGYVDAYVMYQLLEEPGNWPAG